MLFTTHSYSIYLCCCFEVNVHLLVFIGLELKLTQCLNRALLAVDLMQRNMTVFALRALIIIVPTILYCVL